MRLNASTRLVGERLLLVPYDAKHVPVYHSWMEDDKLREQTASERLSLDEEFEMQRKWREDEDKLTFILLEKERADVGEEEESCMVGDVNIFICPGEEFVEEADAEVEVMIAVKEVRGRGFGKEAVRTIIGYAFKHLSLSNFRVKIGYDNTPSLKMFESLGFHIESASEVFRERTLRLTENGLRSVLEYFEKHARQAVE